MTQNNEETQCKCKLHKVVFASVLEMSGCEDMKEAIEYFEEERNKKYMPRTKKLFDEIAVSQLAVLFKLLIDSNELKLVDNKIEDLHK